MKSICLKKTTLPFKCRMLCVSLIGGSVVLAVIFLIYYLGAISIETAIGISFGVFILLALYESFLLSLITGHMIKGMSKPSS
jgi:uncharacterized RDD family membrane protein YckC